MTCHSARNVILAMVRGSSTEADRLRLEQHLVRCQPCRAERAQWALVERVRNQPVRTLAQPARARVLKALVAEAAAPVATEPGRPGARPARRWTTVMVASAAAAMLALSVKVALAPRGAGAPVVVAAGQIVGGAEAGWARFEGAELWYAARSKVRLASARRLELVEGEVEVEVAPGGAERFRVHAPRFIVEVVGTRFVVRPDGMRTVHGAVRVLDLAGRELAVVRAGESWVAPPGPEVAAGTVAASAVAASAARAAGASGGSATSVPVLADVAAQQVRSQTEIAVADAATQRGAGAAPAARELGTLRSARQLLAEARGALAAGRVGEAREHIRSALGAAPLPREHAVADLYAADADRLDGRHERALAAYRLAAERWSHFPEGEQALFAIAVLEAERAPAAAARAALNDYLSRYPTGRFQREAESRLAELPAAP